MASSLRTDEEFMEIYNRHVDTVYRVCFSFMKNAADTEDMVQETFLKLISCKKEFASEKHEKAWLIVTASNTCRDELRRFKRRLAYISSCLRQENNGQAEPGDDISELLLSLPSKYKEVVYLHYYEGLYSGAGVGDFLKGTSDDAKAKYISGWFYADGSFDYDGNAVIVGSSPVTTDYQFSRVMKGTFQGTGLNVGNLEEYEEWNYTTKNGENLLLATNGTTKALIIADKEKSFVTANVLGDILGGSFGIGEDELEKLAEAFDFSVIP